MIKRAAAFIFPYLWAFCSPYTKNRTKPKPNKCGLFARLLQVLPASRQPQPIPTQNASRQQPFIFRRIQSQRAAILKPSLFQKTLHQIAQYSAQYFMQYFTIYFLICSCISGYYVVYFNQDKGKTQRQRSIT